MQGTETSTSTAAAYTPTDRTVPTRSPNRASYDKELVHAILDEAYVCHLGFVRDGAPVVLPTLFARVGERLYVHGSTGSRPLRTASTETRLRSRGAARVRAGSARAKAAGAGRLLWRTAVRPCANPLREPP